jgi:TonB-linked SusC/RagA family outer membrane protein
MKKNFDLWVYSNPTLKKLIMELKIAILFIVVGVSNVFATPTYSQIAKVSLDMKNRSLEQVMDEIESQSEFYFIFNQKQIDVNRVVDIQADNKLITDILPELFKGTNVNYVVLDRKILLTTDPVENNLLAIASVTEPQVKQITGTVADEKGNPIAGVTVLVKGTNNGFVSDISGKYALYNVPQNSTLIFSFVGMVTQEIPSDGLTLVDVVLKEAAIGLNEVVVVGYGTQKKVNLTGAVSSVAGDDLSKRPVTNPVTMLQGSIAGLRIVQGVGQPGAEDLTIQLRGYNSYSGTGNNPLVLIDGVEGSLTNLNANDIENVSVLKDAASAAIYGSRAANGVILVTTKTGKAGKLKILLNSNVGINTPTRMLDLITNSAQYMELANEARRNTGLTEQYTQAMIDTYKNATDRNKYPNFNWIDYMFNPAVVKNYNVSLNAGNESTTYNVSLGYTDQPGTMKGFSYKKYNLRANLKSQIKSWATIGTNISLERGDISAPRQGQNDAFLSTVAQLPTYGPFLPDGSGKATSSAYDFEQHNKNMPAIIANGVLKTETNYDLSTQVWSDIEILKGLHWYSKAAFNFADYSYRDWMPKVSVYNYLTGDQTGSLDVGGSGLDAYNSRNVYTDVFSYLKYDGSFGDHNFSIQAGLSQEYSKFEYLRGQRDSYNFNLTELNSANATNQYSNGSSDEWAIQSLFGRFNYNYKEKYLLEVNARRDGSSRISASGRYGVFPSVSAGWRLTEESFIKNLSLNWLNNVKIRGSYGVLGNQNINKSANGLSQYPYPYQNLLALTGNYSFDNSTLLNGVAQTDLSNANIKWETTTMKDIGLDLTIFKGLSITYDYYNKHTTDILRPAQILAVTGRANGPTVNKGEMINSGHEFAVEYAQTKGEWSYSAGFQIYTNKNKLTNYGAKEINDYYIRQDGYPIDSYYMLEMIGIFQDATDIANSPVQFGGVNTHPGDIKFKDVNNDGVIDQNDRAIIPGKFPKFEYSIHSSVNWKGFDLYLMFQGVQGRKIYTELWGYDSFFQGSPPTTDQVANRWTGAGSTNSNPRFLWAGNYGDNGKRNTWYLQDASYLRLKNLTIGYTIPHNLSAKVKIEKARIYFSGDNLLTFTKYKGLDPERTSDGRFVQYPQNKIVSFGINVEF